MMSLVALALLTATFSLVPAATPAIASSGPARLPAGFHISLPWAIGSTRIACGYHPTCSGPSATVLNKWHANVNSIGSTNDEYALDFGLAKGTPVLAVASGQVKWAGWCNPSPSSSTRCNGSLTWPNYGNSVSIAHSGTGAGFTSFYAHLSRFIVHSGDDVRAGQVIGYVGETGTEGGYHLHFAMYYNAGGAHALHSPTSSPPYGGIAVLPEPFSNCTKTDGSACSGLRMGDVLRSGVDCSKLNGPALPWKVLAVIYTSEAIDYRTPTGASGHLDSSMAPDELAAVHQSLDALPSTVSTWSNGFASMQLTVVESQAPLRSISPIGDGFYWVAPSDIQQDLSALDAGKYDSILVYWKPFSDTAGLPLSFHWGQPSGPTAATHGAYYASMILVRQFFVNTGLALFSWLSGVTMFYAFRGVHPMPLPTDAYKYGYQIDPTYGWTPYYGDIMTGRVRDTTGQYIGLTASVWASGSPTSIPLGCRQVPGPG